MAEEPIDYYSQPGLSKEQKTGFILLVIFAILAIGLGVLQIRNGLYAPFALNNKVPVSLKNDVNSPDSLRFRDTDHDGLNDFDELYVYGTSPYLYDTFSYGMSDKEVVAKNLPLCPKGSCNDVAANPNPEPATSTLGDASVSSATSTFGLENITTSEDLLKAFQDPARIRQMLLQSGVNKESLNKLNDAQLLNAVNEIITASTSLSGN